MGALIVVIGQPLVADRTIRVVEDDATELAASRGMRRRHAPLRSFSDPDSIFAPAESITAQAHANNLRRELGEVLEVAPAPAARGARVGGRTGYRGRRLELPVPRDLELDARLRRLGVRAVGRR